MSKPWVGFRTPGCLYADMKKHTYKETRTECKPEICLSLGSLCKNEMS